MNILVTGGAGFIGSAFIRKTLNDLPHRIINVDRLSYAGDLSNLAPVADNDRHLFIQHDICDQKKMEQICREHEIDKIIHFAAETHVDRSIADPAPFLHSNVEGTYSLLEVIRKNPKIHFHHISTDEVYGSLDDRGAFSENSPYRPNSPYAATKAASDHLVRAYAKTYGLSVTTSHCSNNFGPFQYPEKFIPLMILNALSAKPLPVYGKGVNIRDWLFVEDHIDALWLILEKGKAGEVYDIGGVAQVRNLELLYMLLEILEQRMKKCFKHLIRFVKDRPGHDYRYAIDSSKIQSELGWKPKHSLEEALQITVDWYCKRFLKELKGEGNKITSERQPLIS